MRNIFPVPADQRVPAPSLNISDRRLARLSLAFCGVLAMAFAIMMPPLQITDENGHFIRAYAISRGEFSGWAFPALPVPVIALITRYPPHTQNFSKFDLKQILLDLTPPTMTEMARNTVMKEEDRRYGNLDWSVISSSLYFPVVYFPAAIGIWMARALHASPLAMMYAARLCNVLTLVMAVGISFRLAPQHRAVWAGVALIPMTLHQAGGISADPVTIAFSLVGVSVVLYAREHHLSRTALILVAVLFVLWGLCKSSIWALPLLWLIPVSTFKNRRSWLAYITATSLCMVGALLIWGRITSGNMEAFRAIRSVVAGIHVSANIQLATAHPIEFGRYLLAMIHSAYKVELGHFLGAFGFAKVSLPFWVRSLYLVLLLLVAVTEYSAKPFQLWERAVLLLVFLGAGVLLHAVLSVTDTTLCGGSLGSSCFDYLPVVQGRYLIPFVLPGLLALQQNRLRLPRVNLLALITGAGAVHAIAALALIRSTFY